MTHDKRVANTRNPLSRRLRCAAKDWAQVAAVHDHLVKLVAHADALEAVTKRLLERLRDEWALDEGASMEAEDLALEAEAACILGEPPR